MSEKRKLNLDAILKNKEENATPSENSIKENNISPEKLEIDNEVFSDEKVEMENIVNETEKNNENIAKKIDIEEDDEEKKSKISLSHIKEKFVPKEEIKKVEEIEVEEKNLKNEKTEIFQNYTSDFWDIDSKIKEKNKEKEEKKFIRKRNKRIKKMIIASIFIAILMLIWIFTFLHRERIAREASEVNLMENLNNIKDKIDKTLDGGKNMITEKIAWYDYKIEKITDENWKITYKYDGKVYENLEKLKEELIPVSQKRRKKEILNKVKQKIIEKYKTK